MKLTGNTVGTFGLNMVILSCILKGRQVKLVLCLVKLHTMNPYGKIEV